ncbi:MAG: hypothetical protein GY847_31670 [Proteobacteria bacterium]|nr:hypothetical protein [Pseudomonadota bacterium]
MNAKRRESKDAVYTPIIDRQIIEGFLKDQEAMLKELAQSGFSRQSILKRAEGLGMNKEFYKLSRREGTDPAARKCLRCNKYFASLGLHNRMCRYCRTQ